MNAAIKIQNGEWLYGKTIWSIIRRVYGRNKAIGLWQSCDASPEWGHICIECDARTGGGYNILDGIMYMYGPMGIDNCGKNWDENDCDEQEDDDE